MPKPVFKVIFYNQNEIYEVYARDIYQSELIVNPGEEKLKNEFAGVKRSFVPMQAIIRIDEVERGGEGKIREIKANDKVAQFPSSIPPKPTPSE